MPQYKYKIVNDAGDETTRQGWFSNYEELEETLIVGEYLVSVKKTIERKVSVSKESLLSITGQLGSLLDSGVKLGDALKSIEMNNNDKTICKIAGILGREVLVGNTLSYALKKSNSGIPKYYISAISGGEESNNLVKAINFLYDYIKNIENDKKKVINALMYPLIVFTIAIIASSYMLIEVVPEMSATYSSLDKQLPDSTLAILWMSNTLKLYGWYILGTIFLIMGTIRSTYNSGMKNTYLSIIKKTPFIGTILSNGDNYNILMTTGLLVKQGIPIDASLKISKSGLFFKQNIKKIDKCIDRIVEGGNISDSLYDAEVLNNTMVGIMRAGEMSNKVGERLLDVAKLIKEKQENSIKRLITLMGPISILIIGGMILFIAMGMLMPMFELNNVEL